MKKSYVYGLVLTALMSALSGCGGGGSNIDNTKAQLDIVTFEGGVGDQWLKNAAATFMEMHKEDTDYQDGRVGVQINVKSNRSCGGDSIKDSALKEDIYFTENVDYYYMLNKNKFADITDILTEAQASDDGKRIIDKIDENLLGYMTKDGKVYAVPFYDCFYGLVYDKDLFSAKGLYLKDDGTFTNNPSLFGTGPNGVAGDWDDGLPKTYAEFKSMMELMIIKGVIPYTFASGTGVEYPMRALCSWWSDDEGYDDMNLNYTFNGRAHHLVKSITDGVVTTEEVDITRENGYLVRKQAGIYNALSFVENVLTYDLTKKLYQTYSDNYTVQYSFVNSKYMTGSAAKPIGMMFEGTWWENEAANSFAEARSIYGADSFNYGFMPIPKASEDKIGDATLLNLNNSFGFINAKAKNMKLAKDFFKFLHTDAQMSKFTLTTSMTRGLKYTVSDEDRAGITSYCKDLVSIKESEHVKVVYPYSSLDFVINNSATFDREGWPWETSAYPNNPVLAFINRSSLGKPISAELYFNDHVASLTAAQWANIIKQK